MLTIKEAFIKIKATIIENFGDDIQDIRLEEMETNPSGTYELTISYLIPNKNVSSMASMYSTLQNPFIRQYKKVSIDFNDGTIFSIKIHKNE